MKKIMIKIVYYIVVFTLACIIAGYLMNRDSDDTTAEMSGASFPVITMMYGDQEVDCLHGYAEQMECQYLRDNLVTVDDSRKIEFRIDNCSERPESFSYEIRSMDGSRLIEDTQVKDLSEDKNGVYHGSFAIKDLIEPEKEYMLVYKLCPAGAGSREKDDTIRYYSRIRQTESEVDYELKFVRSFHDATFDRSRPTDITTYIESDSDSSGSSLGKVDIHSSYDMITWGGLAPVQVSDPVIDIREICGNVGVFHIFYVISTKSDKKTDTYYYVNEYFRLRRGKERVFLLDYERDTEQVFSEKNITTGNGTLEIGIEPSDLDFVESDGGNVFAFVNAGTLFSYNVTDNKLIRIFGFSTNDMDDPRTNYKDYGIRILNVDETGNVQFVVHGYMDRGIHEGHVGAAFYSYSSMQDTVEENVYVDSNKSADIVSRDIKKLSYVNKSGTCCFMLDGAIYTVDMTTRENKKVISGLNEDDIRISDTGETAAWQETGSHYACRNVTCINMNDGTMKKIAADNGDYIMPLGFMQENLVYGVAHASDVIKDGTGSVTFPMYKIIIESAEGEKLKTYEKSGIYTISCNINGNQMDLKRIKKSDDGGYDDAGDDQIMDTDKETAGSNSVISTTSETLGEVTAIHVKKVIDGRTMKHLSPQMAVYEGSRETDITADTEQTVHYYVYSMRGMETICDGASEAVNRAYADAGTVTDDAGRIIWIKADRDDRNQIMAIKTPEKVSSDRSISTCIDTIMQYNGISLDTEYMIEQGTTPVDIMAKNIPDIEVLDLTGCSLDAVEYYLNIDIPVMVVKNDGTAVLLTGFNSTETVVFDPSEGTLGKVKTDHLSDTLGQEGCSYITYISTEE